MILVEIEYCWLHCDIGASCMLYMYNEIIYLYHMYRVCNFISYCYYYFISKAKVSMKEIQLNQTTGWK